jgi:hypothetical protein
LQAGTTAAQVNDVLNSASNNATLTFDNGSYSWGSDVTFVNGKGATLICASAGGCTVTGAGIVGMNGTCAGNTTDLIRISGFVFSGGSNRIWFYGDGTSCRLEKVRIDHNTFSNQDAESTIIYFGEQDTLNNFFYGVVDHNTITNASSVNFIYGLQNRYNTPDAGALGSWKNIFIEDNTYSTTNQTNDGGTGFIDGESGVGFVARYNTVTNNRIVVHGSQHGWGPINFEVYGNAIIQNSGSFLHDGYRSVHHQGSATMMVFDNVLTPDTGAGHSSEAIEVLHSGAGAGRGDYGPCDGTQAIDGNRPPTATYKGYPCHRGPGRDIDGLLYPMYGWKNRWSDDNSKADFVCANDYSSNTCTAHIISQRDLFTAVSASANSCSGHNPNTGCSPFSGTTGVGFGPLSERPSSCTTFAATGVDAPDAGRSGVGYWATDAPNTNWNKSNGSGNDGGLYICTATNTWTLRYTPYEYPHPLQN